MSNPKDDDKTCQRNVLLLHGHGHLFITSVRLLYTSYFKHVRCLWRKKTTNSRSDVHHTRAIPNQPPSHLPSKWLPMKQTTTNIAFDHRTYSNVYIYISCDLGRRGRCLHVPRNIRVVPFQRATTRIRQKRTWTVLLGPTFPHYLERGAAHTINLCKQCKNEMKMKRSEQKVTASKWMCYSSVKTER